MVNPTPPLLTPEEIADWDARMAQALKPLPGDDWAFKWNKDAARRKEAVSNALLDLKLSRFAARPDLLVNGLLVALHTRRRFDSSFFWQDDFLRDLAEADTEENRRLAHTILCGWKNAPLSWGGSALTRFFRGTGAQGKSPWSERIGSGVLSSAQGWRGFETDAVVNYLQTYPMGDLARVRDSPDPNDYDVSYKVTEAGGNRFAVTHHDCDHPFMDTLLQALEIRGLGDSPPPLPVKVAKVRTPKTWTIGDQITARNLRDLPQGVLITYTVEMTTYKEGTRSRSLKNQVTVLKTYEALFDRREKGAVYARPIVDGVAFAPMFIFSSPDRRKIVTYMGEGWEGKTMDVLINAPVPRMTQTWVTPDLDKD